MLVYQFSFFYHTASSPRLRFIHRMGRLRFLGRQTYSFFSLLHARSAGQAAPSQVRPDRAVDDSAAGIAPLEALGPKTSRKRAEQDPVEFPRGQVTRRSAIRRSRCPLIGPKSLICLLVGEQNCDRRAISSRIPLRRFLNPKFSYILFLCIHDDYFLSSPVSLL